ncbi:hypothetical protein [Synechococcus sp. KORDI-100]|nr:hypothetical protein [Synechococcus sp. KORDI-100]
MKRLNIAGKSTTGWALTDDYSGELVTASNTDICEDPRPMNQL